ncbi:hypothetical protein IMZ48_19710 [Candidatus Bathyarchaeota archaeon]|nr:hypothetical protein [Candidatus Bathyarchaeota archaeon]
MAGLDSLLQTVAQWGNQWSPEINAECVEIFTAQQKIEFSEERATSVQVAKGVKYGSHERNRLDVSFVFSCQKSRVYVLIRWQ